MYALLDALGATKFWRWLNRHKVTILALHGVMEMRSEEEWAPLRWQMKPTILRRYLRCLSKRYEFISPDEAVAMLAGNIPIRANCMAVTIDDGYLNSLVQALPVMKEFNIQPIVFVVSSMLKNRCYFWFDRLDMALQRYAVENDSLVFAGTRIMLKRSDYMQMRAVCKRLIQISRVKFSDEETRMQELENLIEYLEGASDLTIAPKELIDAWIAPMTADDVRLAVQRGLQVGSHTVSHTRLSTLELKECQRQIEQSKREIEEVTGTKCKYFCYPEGAVDPSVAEMVKAAGYSAAFVSENGLSAVGDDVFQIRRFHLPKDATNAELLARVSGFATWLGNVKRVLMFRAIGKRAQTAHRAGAID